MVCRVQATDAQPADFPAVYMCTVRPQVKQHMAGNPTGNPTVSEPDPVSKETVSLWLVESSSDEDTASPNYRRHGTAQQDVQVMDGSGHQVATRAVVMDSFPTLTARRVNVLELLLLQTSTNEGWVLEMLQTSTNEATALDLETTSKYEFLLRQIDTFQKNFEKLATEADLKNPQSVALMTAVLRCACERDLRDMNDFLYGLWEDVRALITPGVLKLHEGVITNGKTLGTRRMTVEEVLEAKKYTCSLMMGPYKIFFKVGTITSMAAPAAPVTHMVHLLRMKNPHRPKDRAVAVPCGNSSCSHCGHY